MRWVDSAGYLSTCVPTAYLLSTCHAQGWLGYAWRPGQSLGEIMGETVGALDGPPNVIPSPGGAAVQWGWLLLGGLALCTSVFCARGIAIGSPRRI